MRNGTRFSKNSDSGYSDYEPEGARLTDTMTGLKQKLLLVYEHFIRSR
jgi:hypothetical protein